MKKKQNGSFTIEASFVVPIILMVFMASVCISYFTFMTRIFYPGQCMRLLLWEVEEKAMKKRS